MKKLESLRVDFNSLKVKGHKLYLGYDNYHDVYSVDKILKEKPYIENLFKDESNIKRVIFSRDKREIRIEKENSKWILRVDENGYNDGLILIEPYIKHNQTDVQIEFEQ